MYKIAGFQHFLMYQIAGFFPHYLPISLITSELTYDQIAEELAQEVIRLPEFGRERSCTGIVARGSRAMGP